jgi:hypothetical protein
MVRTPAAAEGAAGLARAVDALQIYGVRLDKLGATVEHIDAATNRASAMASVQRLWQDGCGRDTNGDRCRGALFVAMLQYRLTDNAHFDVRGPSYRHTLKGLLTRKWAQLWPAGLLIPSADIGALQPMT